MLDHWMRAFLRPNPTRHDVPGHPPGLVGELDDAPARVTCWQHQVCLYRGEHAPAGGGPAVAAAAGCPRWDSDAPEPFTECPVPAEHGAGPVFDHTDPTAGTA